jgi:hypothetical protein
MLHVRINVPPIPEALEALAEGLVGLNCFYMEHAADNGAVFPPLEGSGIRYRREPHGREWWESAQDVLGVTALRSGDCEDLAAYHAAWLRTSGEDEDAHVRIVPTRRGTFHAIVQRGDGSFEDPSRQMLNEEHARLRGFR